jgi:hypothetical protein
MRVMPIVPPFDSDGLLPPGDYELSFDELRQSALVCGARDRKSDSTWDTAWREQLVNGLEILVRQLWQVGIREIFADGSFVEDKDHPNDIDGYFVCDLMPLATGELAQQLNRLDPFKVWTWDPASRRPYRGYPKRQLPMCPDLVSEAASATSTVTSLSFLPHSVSRAGMASREAS